MKLGTVPVLLKEFKRPLQRKESDYSGDRFEFLQLLTVDCTVAAAIAYYNRDKHHF